MQNSPTYLDTFLQKAESNNIKVYMGLTSNVNVYCGSDFRVGESKTLIVKDYNYLMNYFKTNLKYFGTIDGWYIPDEPQLAWDRWDEANIYYKELVNSIKKYSSKPIIISPYLVGAQSISPTAIANNALNFIKASGIDIFIIQDSEGGDCKLQGGKYTIKQYFTNISTKIGKEHLWANNELFNCGYTNGWDGGGYQPTSITRLNSQIRMTNKTLVSGRVNWVNQFHMTKVANNKMIGSDRLFDSYVAQYGGGSLKMLKPTVYTWKTQPSRKYPDTNMAEMFDSKLGNVNNSGDSAWTGIEGKAEMVMNFGTSKNIKWVSFHFMSLKTPSISFPETLSLSCSQNGSSWISLGTWKRDLKIYGQTVSEKTGPSEYDFSNTTPLNTKCKYVKANLSNSDWTFISEVEVVGSN